jgi:hypothetical protein
LETGSGQYDNLKSGLTNMTGFYDPIKKNNGPLFSRNSNTRVSGTKSKLDIAKDDCSLFSRLFISCQSRQLDFGGMF